MKEVHMSKDNMEEQALREAALQAIVSRIKNKGSAHGLKGTYNSHMPMDTMIDIRIDGLDKRYVSEPKRYKKGRKSKSRSKSRSKSPSTQGGGRYNKLAQDSSRLQDGNSSRRKSAMLDSERLQAGHSPRRKTVAIKLDKSLESGSPSKKSRNSKSPRKS